MSVAERELERVRALIARTASPSEEEARTCAFLACKQMRELGLDVAEVAEASVAGLSRNEVVALKTEALQLRSLVADLKQRLARSEKAADDYRDTCTVLQTTVNRLKAEKVLANTPAPKAAGRRTKTGEPMDRGGGEGLPRPPRGFQRMEGFTDTRRIKAKYQSVCRSCGNDIDEGDDVIWTPGEGVQCVDCG
jgi:hypothetical protein